MADPNVGPMQVGAEIEAEWLPGRPWVKGVIESVDVFSGTYNVRYEDGYRQYSKPRNLIRTLGPPTPNMPSWSLICMDGPGLGGATLIPIGNEVMQMSIGRQCQAPAFWDQLIPDERLRNSVSREHCQIRCAPPGPGTPAAFMLVNKSSAGSTVNGAPVQHEAPLQDGDVVGVGNSASPGGLLQTVLHFRFVVHSGTGAPQPPSPTVSGAAGGGAVAARFCFECVEALGRPPADLMAIPEAERLMLADPSPPGRGLLRVGRERQPPELWARLILEDMHRNKISREHFEVTLAGAEARLVNISGAGTLVNGSRIRESIGLKPGDVVAFPISPDDATPVACFRFWLGDSPAAFGGGASVAPAPAPAAGGPGAAPAGVAAGPQVLRLACVAIQGAAPDEVRRMPDAARCLELSGPLRVGRTSTPGFLEALVRDERVRNMISREHFEVRLDESGRPIVANLSGAGTIVDGTRIKETAPLRPGSLIAVPGQAAGDADPAVVFELETLCGGQLVGSQDQQAARPSPDESHVARDRRPTTYPAAPPPISASSGPGTNPVDYAVQAEPAVAGGDMPFVLECVSALGLSTADLSFKPNFARFLGPTSHIRVGRMVQPQEVWQELVPNDSLRNMISREQFEISAAEPGVPVHFLTNKASAGTFLNEQPVLQRAQLNPNDIIGVGLAPNDSTQPILRFRFLVGDAARGAATAATVPANRAMPQHMPQY